MVEIHPEHAIAVMFISWFIDVVEHLNIKIQYPIESKAILSKLEWNGTLEYN